MKESTKAWLNTDWFILFITYQSFIVLTAHSSPALWCLEWVDYLQRSCWCFISSSFCCSLISITTHFFLQSAMNITSKQLSDLYDLLNQSWSLWTPNLIASPFVFTAWLLLTDYWKLWLLLSVMWHVFCIQPIGSALLMNCLTMQNNWLNCLQLTSSMLQPCCHPSYTCLHI